MEHCLRWFFCMFLFKFWNRVWSEREKWRVKL